jgi:hypothetical protein
MRSGTSKTVARDVFGLVSALTPAKTGALLRKVLKEPGLIQRKNHPGLD